MDPPIALVSNFRGKRIPDDGESDGDHVNPQLVLPPLFGDEPEEPGVSVQVEQLNFCDRVGRAFHNLLAMPRLTWLRILFSTCQRLWLG